MSRCTIHRKLYPWQLLKLWWKVSDISSQMYKWVHSFRSFLSRVRGTSSCKSIAFGMVVLSLGYLWVSPVKFSNIPLPKEIGISWGDIQTLGVLRDSPPNWFWREIEAESREEKLSRENICPCGEVKQGFWTLAAQWNLVRRYLVGWVSVRLIEVDLHGVQFTFLYSSVNFDKCIESCNHCHTQDGTFLSPPPKVFSYPFRASPSLCPHPLATMDLSPVTKVLLFPECYIHGTKSYIHVTIPYVTFT